MCVFPKEAHKKNLLANALFFMCKYIHVMFFKEEKPEMNDFEEEKNFGSKGYPCKNATKYFA